jgi:hypothetical protein
MTFLFLFPYYHFPVAEMVEKEQKEERDGGELVGFAVWK